MEIHSDTNWHEQRISDMETAKLGDDYRRFGVGWWFWRRGRLAGARIRSSLHDMRGNANRDTGQRSQASWFEREKEDCHRPGDQTHQGECGKALGEGE